MKITLNLDRKSIKKALRELKAYENSMRLKTELLVSRLLDEGISVAYQHIGKYKGYVEFTKVIENGQKQCIGMLVGKDSQPFYVSWLFMGGVKTVVVSGLLMSEFGSGWLANVIWDVPGVGQGTFPGQKHAFDKRWFWRDVQGNLHSSRGEEPHYPMYFADMTMLSQIDKIGREVFSNANF